MPIPCFGATGAQPGERGADIGRLVCPDRYADRLLGAAPHEDLLHWISIADRPLVERVFDALVRLGLAPGHGGGEVGMMAAPVIEGGRRDIEEIGHLAVVQAVTEQFERLIGMVGPTGIAR